MTSKIVVNNIEPDAGISTVSILGIATATKFVGDVEGAVTGAVTGNVTGNVTGSSGSCTGNAATATVASGITTTASVNTSGIVTATTFVPTAGQISNRNKIINGGMKIFQRGTSAQRSGGNDGYYNGIADRWAIRMHSSVAQTLYSEDTTDNPEGFGTNQKSVRSNAGSSNAAKYYVFDTKLEGQDLQDFAKGTSAAKEFTLSFYIKTGVSGVYTCELRDLDNTRTVVKQYTVSNGNWNRYTLTFPADTTGKFGNDNGASLWVRFWLAAGTNFTSGTSQTTWASSVDANICPGQTAQVGDNVADLWQITGVQLEVGSVATPFEHRSYGDEMLRCKRYFQPFIQYAEYVSGGTGNLGFPYTAFTVPMRASPTFLSDHESKSSNWSFASMQVQGSDAYGYYAYAISYNTTNSNYGYMRKYGQASAEL